MSVDKDPWPSTVRAWWAVAVFCALAILSYTDRQILSLLVDPIRGELGVSDTQVGILQGVAFAVVYSIAGLPLGRYADVLSRRRLILGGIVVWSLATIACAFSAGFGHVFVARMFVGVGEAALAPAAVSMISDLFPPRRRGTAIGVFLAGMIVGGGVAIGAGGFLLEQAQHGLLSALPFFNELSPWRAVLAFLGLLGIPAFLLMATVIEPVRRNATDAAPPLREVVNYIIGSRRVILPIMGALALMAVGDFSLLNWTPSLLMRRYALTPTEVGAVLSGIAIITGLVGVVGGGYLADRLSGTGGTTKRLRLPIVTTVAALLATPFGFTAASASQALFAFGWWMVFSSATTAAGIAAVQAIVPPRLRGTSVALTSFGSIFLGLGVGATLTPLLSDRLYSGPGAIGVAISTIVIPACALAIGLLTLAWVGSRAQDRTERLLM